MVIEAKAKTSAFIDSMKWTTSQKQQDGASHPLDQSDTSQLQAQLTTSEVERQRLRQKYDALRTSHAALTTRCSQLESQLQASQAAERSSSAKAAAATQQLEGMSQQLKDANRFLDQQHKVNKQQAAQLQQALNSLAGKKWKAGEVVAAAAATQQQLQQALGAKEREVKALSGQVAQLSAALAQNKQTLAAAGAQGAAFKQQLVALNQQHKQLQADHARIQREAAAAAACCQTEQQQMKQQVADMAAAVAAADAARCRTQRDEAAVLQAMAHLAQQHAEDRQQLQTLQEQLPAAVERAIKAEGLAEWFKLGVTETHGRMLGLVMAAEQRASRAEARVAPLRVAINNMKKAWDEGLDEIEADWQKCSSKYKAQLAQMQQQAAADKAALEGMAGEVARLRQCLGLVGDANQVTNMVLEPALKQQGSRRGGIGLKLLWQNIRWVSCLQANIWI
jgi:chromosome segregation ATPase